MVMMRDLYGLKGSVVGWIRMIVETLRNINFVPTVAETDIYRGRVRKPNFE